MTDTNTRPWRDRITATGECGLTWPSDVNLYPAVRGLLDEAHALAAERDNEREKALVLAAEVERLRTLLATPADGPLRVERDATGNESHPHNLWILGKKVWFTLNDAEADAIEAQLAARPALDLPDGVQPWTAAPIEIDGVPVVAWAMGDVVRSLDDDEWLRAMRDRWELGSNTGADWPGVYLLGRKPQPTPPPTITVELPQDVAEWASAMYATDAEGYALVAACRKALGR